VEKDKEEISKKMEKSELDIYEEMSLREEKRKNVVIHGMDEPDGADGRSRMDHIFTALDVNIAVESDVEFCRRVGEKAERSRPLIVGFYTEWTKSVLLKHSKYLVDTEYSNVTISPDLTERQRKAEKRMLEEAERRNREELTDDDRAKNWVWKVMGRKGQKRLVKGFDQFRGRGRGAGAAGGMNRGRGNLLPAVAPRGRWEPRASASGAAGAGRGTSQRGAGGAASRGMEREAGMRKRRHSGGEEGTRKRGTVRGRPTRASQRPSQQSSQVESTEEEEEEEEEVQEVSSQQAAMSSEGAEMEEEEGGNQPPGIRLGEE
jgi:hypothetical protein